MSRRLIDPHFGSSIVYAYRMSHIENIPYLCEKGFVLETSSAASSNYVSIGDCSVIDKRKEIVRHGYVLANYIPFYFGPRTPMLHVIQNGFNFVKRQKAEDIVYCVIKIQDIIDNGIKGVFTDGHALTSITSYYPLSSLKDVDKYVKVEDVYATFWKDEDDIDLKRRKEAELLVEDSLSADFISGFIVYNEESRDRLVQMGVGKKIMVIPSFYF